MKVESVKLQLKSDRRSDSEDRGHDLTLTLAMAMAMAVVVVELL